MPLYTYNCECGHEFEGFNKMSERESHECPKCGRAAQQGVCGTRLVQGTSIGGFYEHLSTDGVEIRSRRHLRDECRAREKYAPYVFD